MAESPIINLSDKPILPLLTFIETSQSSGEGLRIIEKIGAKHRALGIQLLDDEQGVITDVLVANHPNDVNEVTRGIFKKWLTTRGRRPITWATFIAVLKEIDLNQLAGDIEILAGSTPGDEPAAADVDDVVKSKPPQPDKDDIIVLEKEIKGFNLRFNSIKISTIQCLEKCGIAIATVVMLLTSLVGVGESREFLKEEHESLDACKTHWILFGKLNFHWNPLSYRLLQGLLESLSENKEFNEVNERMEKYDKDMGKFRAKTLLVLFCQVSPKLLFFDQTTKPPPREFKMLVTKLNWPESITLQDVEEFRINFSNEFGLPKCAMMVYRIKRGSFEITWLAILPSGIVPSLRSPKAVAFFKQFKVTSISINGEQIYQELSFLQAKVDVLAASSGFSSDRGYKAILTGPSSSSVSGTETQEYKAVLTLYEDLTGALDANKDARKNLKRKMVKHGWVKPSGGTEMSEDIMAIVMNRIEHESVTIHLFIEMLKEIPGLKHLTEKISLQEPDTTKQGQEMYTTLGYSTIQHTMETIIRSIQSTPGALETMNTKFKMAGWSDPIKDLTAKELVEYTLERIRRDENTYKQFREMLKDTVGLSDLVAILNKTRSDLIESYSNSSLGFE